MLLNIMSYTPFVKPDILQNIISYLPGETQKIFQNFIKEITTSSSQSLLSISAIAGVWSSSSGIKAVIRAIDKAYDYSESRSYIKLRIMSFFFTIALLLLIILVFSTLIFGEVLANKLFTALGLNFFFSILWAYVRILIPLVYMILIFALLYKYSPSRKKSFKISFKNALPGAIFTTLGWMLTSILFSYYVNNFGNFALTYGSLVGIIVLFIWLYISSFIIVLGGEVNATLEFFRVNGCKINNNKSLISNFLDKL